MHINFLAVLTAAVASFWMQCAFWVDCSRDSPLWDIENWLPRDSSPESEN